MNWQPIDTAPKDGTRILMWEAGDVVLAKWCKDQHGRQTWRPYTFRDGDYNGGGIRHVGQFWMPAPEGPAGAWSKPKPP